jgi:hypothetical protein
VVAQWKNRLSGWRSQFLSFGGRLVLLKSVLTSLPIYALFGYLEIYLCTNKVWMFGGQAVEGV